MSWPFEKPKDQNPPNPDAAAADQNKPPEKTAAEMIAEALQPAMTKMEAMAREMDEIKKNTTKPAPKLEPSELTSVLDDENAAFSQRLTPVVLRQLELEARIIKNDIKAEYNRAGYGDLWDQFEGEINQIIDASPLVNGEAKPLRGDPQYIRNVVDMVMGRAARKAGMRFDGKNKGFFLETASGDGGLQSKPESDGMSDSQRKIMQRMKIPLDDAKKVMSKLKFVS